VIPANRTLLRPIREGDTQQKEQIPFFSKRKCKLTACLAADKIVFSIPVSISKPEK
jgi:hypothetical protein